MNKSETGNIESKKGISKWMAGYSDVILPANAEWWRPTEGLIEGKNAMAAIAGGFGELQLLANSVLSSTIIEISVYAKSKMGIGRFSLMYHDIGSWKVVSIDIENRDWELYTLRLAVGDLKGNTNYVKLRFISKSETSIIHFDYPVIRLNRYNN
jgi:hypothetical protein